MDRSVTDACITLVRVRACDPLTQQQDIEVTKNRTAIVYWPVTVTVTEFGDSVRVEC